MYFCDYYNFIFKSYAFFIVYKKNPSAGIGRQDKFKLCWHYVVNVQVVFWIKALVFKI